MDLSFFIKAFTFGRISKFFRSTLVKILPNSLCSCKMQPARRLSFKMRSFLAAMYTLSYQFLVLFRSALFFRYLCQCSQQFSLSAAIAFSLPFFLLPCRTPLKRSGISYSSSFRIPRCPCAEFRGSASASTF